MDDPKLTEVPQQPIPGQPRTKPKFVARHVLLPKPSPDLVPMGSVKKAEPDKSLTVVHPEIGESAVRIELKVSVTDRFGRVFNEADSAVLDGSLDPSQRGHFARSVEINFERMAHAVVSTYSKMVEARNAETNGKATAPPEDVTGFRLTKAIPEFVSDVTATTPPHPKMPGVLPPMPALNPIPPPLQN